MWAAFLILPIAMMVIWNILFNSQRDPDEIPFEIRPLVFLSRKIRAFFHR